MFNQPNYKLSSSNGETRSRKSNTDGFEKMAARAVRKVRESLTLDVSLKGSGLVAAYGKWI